MSNGNVADAPEPEVDTTPGAYEGEGGKQPVVQTDSGDETKHDSAVELEARAVGWVPESEWRNPNKPPAGGFVSADQFVSREMRQRLKDDNAALTSKLERLERETADKIARMERMSSTALKTQREQLESKFEALKESAVDVGDKTAYREADQAQRTALKEFDEKAEEPKTEKRAAPDLPRDIKETIDGWVADNGWFNVEKGMNKAANAYHAYLLETKPGLTIKENLAKVREHIQSEFPDKFEKVKPKDDEGDDDAPRGSRVEGGSRMNGNGGKSNWSKIPDEAKRAADKFIKDEGLFLEKGETVEKNLTQARERYAAQYLDG